jgi:hypothetical protein
MIRLAQLRIAKRNLLALTAIQCADARAEKIQVFEMSDLRKRKYGHEKNFNDAVLFQRLTKV